MKYKEDKKDMIRCAQCKKLKHPLELVFIWVKTLCGKCATRKLMNVGR